MKRRRVIQRQSNPVPKTLTHTPAAWCEVDLLIEPLEDRRMLSSTVASTTDAALSSTATSLLVRSDTSATATPAKKAHASAATLPAGYGPAQIAKMYGFNLVSGDGTGQTIAIVDAYNDPNIASDLAVFNKTYGLAAANLTVVNQNGSTKNLPATNGDWSGEIALDVEWAHAMAPGAKIVLVEANSDSLSDLLAAVNTARNLAGVSVVSMSWGGSEFSSETRYDGYFTTPAGHTGVTFVASSGDDGSSYGPSWPASSPNVLSVGGTTLYTTARGTWGLETGWSGSGGGASSYEAVPSYQTSTQSTGRRTSPDVSYDANPSTGFAVYNTVADSYGDAVGWSVVGGTSAGAPQWAALIAIANQLRVAGGAGTLDGASGTLPTLYGLYGTGTGAGTASTYASAFRDVTSGRTSTFMAAHAGYDGVTGLGSPMAGTVVSALVDAVTAAVRRGVTTTAVAGASAARAARVREAALRLREEQSLALVDATATTLSANSTTPAGAAENVAVASVDPAIAGVRALPAEVSTARASREEGFSAARSTPQTAASAGLQNGWTPWFVGPGSEANFSSKQVPWKSENSTTVAAPSHKKVFALGRGPFDEFTSAAGEATGPSVFTDARIPAAVPDDGSPESAGGGSVVASRTMIGLALGAIIAGNWYARRSAPSREDASANGEDAGPETSPFALGRLDR